MNILNQLRNLAVHVNRRRRTQLWGIFVLTLFSTLAELVSVGVVLPFLAALSSPESLFSNSVSRQVMMMIGIEQGSEVVPTLTILFIAAAVFAGGTRYMLMWAQTRVSFSIGADLASAIYRRTLYQPYETHLSRNSSEIVAAITTKVRDVINQVIVPVIGLTSSVFILVSMCVFLVAIDPIVAVIAFALFGSLYYVIAISVKGRLIEHGRTMSAKQNEVVQTLQEGLMGIRDVLLTASQEVYLTAFRNADKPARDATANIIIISQAPRFAIEATGMILVAVVAYLLVVVMGKASAALPVLGALALGAQRMLPLLQQAYWSFSQLFGGKATLNDVLNLLNQPMTENRLSSTEISFNREIELKDVAFSYGTDRPAVLSGVNFRIPKGACVGVIGETGSGKSTLIDIIMGLMSPKNGNLLVDGVAVGPVELRAWQKHISHVPQAIYLADVSIAQNIAFGVPSEEIDMARVMESARQARISDVIESWEDDYQTLVGEQGVRLSGGQRQRIGIARALYRNADVIIFDEATSALDQQTENLVMHEINRLSDSLTVIIIAHRLSTLTHCDFLIELGNGRIRNIGTYDEVVTQTNSQIQFDSGGETLEKNI